MGIEPEQPSLQSRQNAAFREALIAACDRRANYRITLGNVGLCETTTPFVFRFPFPRPKQLLGFSDSSWRNHRGRSSFADMRVEPSL
jgi:hypothetical protein